MDRKQAIAKNMEKGDDFLTAYARMVDDVAKNDKGFQALKAKAQAAGTDQERSRVYDEMAAYAQQGILGDIVGDLQAKRVCLPLCPIWAPLKCWLCAMP